ncbi:MAG: hypothetical protein ACTSUE_11925 [Promethearchaeota archaeon]
MIWLIIVETALELIPPVLHKHPSIVSFARKRGKKPSQLLLNTTFHHSAMKNLQGAEKRGRPDILHLCLLGVLNTPLARIQKCLKVGVHLPFPIERMIAVDERVNLPRAFNRFEGLMAKLLVESDSTIGAEPNPFLEVKKIPLEKFLEKFDPRCIHALSRSGTRGTFLEVVKKDGLKSCGKNQDLVILIGGFQSGHFSKATLQLIPPTNIHNISEMPLDAWTVAARAIFLLEMQVDKGLYQ